MDGWRDGRPLLRGKGGNAGGVQCGEVETSESLAEPKGAPGEQERNWGQRPGVPE